MLTRTQNYARFKQNPEMALFQRLQEIEKEIEVLINEKKEELEAMAEKIINQKLSDNIFGNLEPAKKLAEKTAKQQMEEFKTDIKEQVDYILSDLRERKDKIIDEMEKMAKEEMEIAGRHQEDIKNAMSGCKTEIEKVSSHKTTLEKMMSDCEMEHNEMMKNIQSQRGPQGEQGIPGINGKSGIDGKDGSPDKPEDIANKLNTLKEVLSWNLIKGLSNELTNLRNNIKEAKRGRSGGGGMGNVIAETPSGLVNGSNKTFTLTYSPKSNSLIFLLNGQFQRVGSSFEYTLNDKTITMINAPLSGGETFAWYIRA